MGAFENGNKRFVALDGGALPAVISHYQQSSAVTVANTAAETSVISTGIGTPTFGAGFFKAGSVIRIKILGTLQTASAAETLRVRAYLGSAVIFDTTALTVPNIATATVVRREVDSSFSVVGATGTCNTGSTEIIYSTSPATFGASSTMSTATVNTNIAETLNITYQWGAASASNSAVIYGIVVEVLG